MKRQVPLRWRLTIWSVGSIAIGLAMVFSVYYRDDHFENQWFEAILFLGTLVPAAVLLVFFATWDIGIAWIYFAMLACVYIALGVIRREANE